jgi:Sulfotransferase family
VKVIFIASLSHSGSTLLDLMLNAHPDVVSVGELKQLGRFARLEKPGRRLRCTCGAESLWVCEFWSKVSAHIEASIGRTIGNINVENYDDAESFDRDNAAVFRAVAEVSGKDYVVDSSKQIERLERLMAIDAIEVIPVFLLRDPKGQMCSAQKRPIGFVKLIENYVRTNRRIYHLVRNKRHAVIHYEELVQRPEETLQSLMQQLGLSFDRSQMLWASHIRHNVGGNGMRRRETSELKLDERWREHWNVAQRLVIDAATLPGRFPFVKLGAT